MTDNYLLDAPCIHGNHWDNCPECWQGDNMTDEMQIHCRLSWHEAHAAGDALAVAIAFWTVLGTRELADGLESLVDAATAAREAIRRAVIDTEDAALDHEEEP